MLTLIAKWNITQDPAVDMPNSVTWGNRRPATLQDYITHRQDTRELVTTSRGGELRMYPELIADVRYDYYTGMWWVVPRGEAAMSLDLHYEATNEDILAELGQLPRIYRSLIHR